MQYAHGWDNERSGNGFEKNYSEIFKGGERTEIPWSIKCVYGWSNERSENGDGEDVNEIYIEVERVEIAWPLVCR